LTTFPLTDVTGGGIALGSDGNLWVTEGAGTFFPSKIGRITPAGALTDFDLPSGSSPGSIVAGPDRNLWFTESPHDANGNSLGYAIGRITTSGVLSQFALPAGNSGFLFGIAAGPDGNIWFCQGGSIGRLTPGGGVQEFSLPLNPGTVADAITTGPDRNLWVVTSDTLDVVTPFPSTQLLAITPSGQVLLDATLPPALHSSITVGPDGNLWFTADTLGETLSPSDAIFRVRANTGGGPAGLDEVSFNTPTPDANAAIITTGPDGNLWFTDAFSRIGRITPGGTITEFQAPDNSEPSGIVTGPDGNLWYVDFEQKQIVRINFHPVDPMVQYVDQLYHQLLQRYADQAGRDYFVGLLNQGVSRSQVVLDIEASPEYRTLAVEQLYQSLLGRSADPAGLSSFVAYLGAGHSVEDVKVQILGSAEYYARSGGTKSGFLAALYSDVLGRAIDPTGQVAFSRILDRGFSTGVVALFVVHSTEARQDVVEGFYQDLLHRQADPAGLASFTASRPGGFPDEAILAAILGSDEYFAQFNTIPI
jgi:virginiamycin B lyase